MRRTPHFYVARQENATGRILGRRFAIAIPLTAITTAVIEGRRNTDEYEECLSPF